MKRWDVLARLAQRGRWRAGVELGVFRGETFRHLLQACPDLQLTGVDRFDSAYFRATRDGRPAKQFDLEGEYAQLAAWILRRAPARARLIRADTVTAAADFAAATLDFVFVDADHRYAAVAADIAAWRDKIRPGGMMLGHDWNAAEFPGVIQAVGEAFAGRAVRLYDDHVWGVSC